ncbi:MAG: hypothetical protein AAGC55_34565, partial [Myxococcota bacterium]
MRDAESFARRYRGDLPALQREYLRAVLTLATRSSRRRRWAVAGTIGFLSILVAAALIALIVIRDAQQAAEDQLAQTLAAQQARVAAESQVKVVQKEVSAKSEELEVADQALGEANRALEDRNAALAEALAEARREAERAERERVRALREKAAAQAARLEAERLSIKLRHRLEDERRRAESLAAQLGLIIEDFEIVKATK